MVGTERRSQGKIAIAGFCYNTLYNMRFSLLVSIGYTMKSFISIPLSCPRFSAYNRWASELSCLRMRINTRDLKEPQLIRNICHDKMPKYGEKGGVREKKQTRDLSRMPPWLLSTPLIVSGSVGDATFFFAASFNLMSSKNGISFHTRQRSH